MDEPSIELTVEHRGNRQVVTLEGPRHVVGRHDDCDLVLKLDGVSRRHFLLVCEARSWFVERHPESSQPLYLEGRVVSGRTAIQSGDVLTLAAVEVTLHPLGGTSMDTLIQSPGRTQARGNTRRAASPPDTPAPPPRSAPPAPMPVHAESEAPQGRPTVDFDEADWSRQGLDTRAQAAAEAARRERTRRNAVLGVGALAIVGLSAFLLWPEAPPPAPPAAPEKDLCELPFVVSTPAVCAAPPECGRLASEQLAKARRVIETAQADPARQWEALAAARAAVIMGDKSEGLFSRDQMHAAAQIAERVSNALKGVCRDMRHQKSVALRNGQFREAVQACRRVLAHVPDPGDPRFAWARECIADVERMAIPQ